MTAQAPSNLDELLGSLAAIAGKLGGADGSAVREHLQHLATVLAMPGSEAEQRARTADALDRLIGVIAQLVGLRGPAAKALKDFPLPRLADGLSAFVAYLRDPSTERQAAVEQQLSGLPGLPELQPVPLDELPIRARVESLAEAAARRRGLRGAAARREVDRIKREMTALLQQVDREVQDNAGRVRALADMERLLDRMAQLKSPLSQALTGERAALLEAFRRVDLARMAEGLRTFGQWVATPADDPAAHIAALRTQFAAAIGPPTMSEPAQSDTELRAELERRVQVAVDQILLAKEPS